MHNRKVSMGTRTWTNVHKRRIAPLQLRHTVAESMGLRRIRRVRLLARGHRRRLSRHQLNPQRALWHMAATSQTEILRNRKAVGLAESSCSKHDTS